MTKFQQWEIVLQTQIIIIIQIKRKLGANILGMTRTGHDRVMGTEQRRQAMTKGKTGNNFSPYCHVNFSCPCMSKELKLTLLLGPLFFAVLCFFLGLFTPCLNHGPHRFLGLFRIFKFLHGSGSTDLTALLCFPREKRTNKVQKKGTLTPRSQLELGSKFRSVFQYNLLPLNHPQERRKLIRSCRGVASHRRSRRKSFWKSKVPFNRLKALCCWISVRYLSRNSRCTSSINLSTYVSVRIF